MTRKRLPPIEHIVDRIDNLTREAMEMSVTTETNDYMLTQHRLGTKGCGLGQYPERSECLRLPRPTLRDRAKRRLSRMAVLLGREFLRGFGFGITCNVLWYTGDIVPYYLTRDCIFRLTLLMQYDTVCSQADPCNRLWLGGAAPCSASPVRAWRHFLRARL